MNPFWRGVITAAGVLYLFVRFGILRWVCPNCGWKSSDRHWGRGGWTVSAKKAP